MIAQSFGAPPGAASPNLDLCLYRPRHSTPASSYILRSAATGSRTIVNHYGLPEMEVREFKDAASQFFVCYRMSAAESSLWHFEGRMPTTTLACIKYLRAQQYNHYGTEKEITISVEVEKPGREGLRDLAAVADIIFYSKSWAEVCYCLPILLSSQDTPSHAAPSRHLSRGKDMPAPKLYSAARVTTCRKGTPARELCIDLVPFWNLSA